MKGFGGGVLEEALIVDFDLELMKKNGCLVLV